MTETRTMTLDKDSMSNQPMIDRIDDEGQSQDANTPLDLNRLEATYDAQDDIPDLRSPE